MKTSNERRCRNCKGLIIKGSNYCSGCGKPLNKSNKGLFRTIWVKRLGIALVAIFIMSTLSLVVVAIGFARQEKMIKDAVSTYIQDNKDQLKGEKGDRGETGLPGLNGVNGSDGYSGGLNCSSSSIGSTTWTNCY